MTVLHERTLKRKYKEKNEAPTHVFEEPALRFLSFLLKTIFIVYIMFQTLQNGTSIIRNRYQISLTTSQKIRFYLMLLNNKGKYLYQLFTYTGMGILNGNMIMLN